MKTKMIIAAFAALLLGFSSCNKDENEPTLQGVGGICYDIHLGRFHAGDQEPFACRLTSSMAELSGELPSMLIPTCANELHADSINVSTRMKGLLMFFIVFKLLLDY